jgi:hypothetical protein
MVGVLTGFQVSHLLPAAGGLAMTAGMLSLPVLVPTYLIWSLCSGVRLLRGRCEILLR